MSRDAFPDIAPCPHALPPIYVPPCVCDLPEDVDDPGAHLPACPWFDAAHDAADHGPPEPEETEYDWLVPGGPEDPDRPWAYRDSGE